MKSMFRQFVLFFICLVITLSPLTTIRSVRAEASSNYEVGVGIGDITGPPAEIVMMGYADSSQSNRGLHLRLRSRAFIVKEPNSDTRLVYVGTDLGMCFQSIKTSVVNTLAEKGYGDLYNEKNVMINATHSHNGPGGYSHHGLYNVSTFGFIEENFNTIVNGITDSIIKAHSNLEPGYLEYNSGALTNATKNRSKVAYNLNPAEEKSKFDTDVDTTMHLLNFRNANGKLLGVLNWFAIHSCSMTVNNLLISSDNKGTASYLFEKEMATNYGDNKTFVCAFAQANCGDVSPNHDGNPLELKDNGLARTLENATLQYEKAKELSDSATVRVTGPLAYRHQYVNMSNETINPLFTDGTSRRTYPGAMGYSFAYGAEDNPTNIPFFKEGMRQPEFGLGSSDNYIKYIQNFVYLAPKFNQINGSRYPELWQQHYPKPILFATSKATPDPWTPQIVPVQLFTIGQLAIIGIPAEVTTMSGRRMQSTVEEQLFLTTGREYTAIVSGHTNSYTSYLTTPEEYDSQQYEGASTQFGKWTLSAYLQRLHGLATAIGLDQPLDAGPTPPDLSDEQKTFETPVIFDNTLAWDDFGDVDSQPRSSYQPGEVASATFWSGHPNNDFRNGGSYLEIQRQVGNAWETVAYDWDLETKFRWKRHSVVLGTSRSTIEWEIPLDVQEGVYRIKHNGAYKTIGGHIYQYEGISNTFVVYRP